MSKAPWSRVEEFDVIPVVFNPEFRVSFGRRRALRRQCGEGKMRYPFALLAAAAFLLAAFCGTGRPEGLPGPGGTENPHAAGEGTLSASGGAAAPWTKFRIVGVVPHDAAAFTEGLVFSDGFLYESTGLNGVSSVRKVDIPTGKVLKITALPPEYFGEGLTAWRGTLVQLTWQSQVGFIYDRESLKKIGEFPFDGEGWGLTSDGESLVVSDGSATLRFLDPATFRETRRLPVTDGGRPVENLNELEYIEGEIFANIWKSDVIARISPRSGAILGWLDLSGLRRHMVPAGYAEVLNGIAFDPDRKRLFVTGKYWPKLFELELVH